MMTDRIYTEVSFTFDAHAKYVIRASMYIADFILDFQPRPFGVKTRELGLLDNSLLTKLGTILMSEPTPARLELDKEETLNLYALIDVCCKAYLTDISDDIRESEMEDGRSAELVETYRLLYLSLAEQFQSDIKDILEDDADLLNMQSRLEALDVYV